MARVEVITCDGCGEEMNGYGEIVISNGDESWRLPETCFGCRTKVADFAKTTFGLRGSSSDPLGLDEPVNEDIRRRVLEPITSLVVPATAALSVELNAQGKQEKPVMVPGQPCSECGSIVGKERCEFDICHEHAGGGLRGECPKCIEAGK